jgi:drug/metabolite transporter (DMT)-like permease
MWSGDVSALLLGVVSGSLWGLFAVLTKGVVDQLDDGIWPLLRSPELYGWALVAILAATLQQSSFRAGTMTASLPAMTVAEPVVGSVLGIVVLGESLRTTDLGWLALGVAIAAMVAATAALARGQALGADSSAVNDIAAKSARLT